MHFISRLLYFFAILLTLVSSLAAQEHDQYSLLKIPTELQSDVSFWIRIYSSVSRQRGLLHDSENLNIIYYETSDNRIEIDNYRKKTDIYSLGIDVVKILGDGAVGAGLGLGHKMVDILVKTARLRMHLRIGRDLDTEGIGKFGLNKGD